MLVDQALGLGQADAVDDRGMIETIGDDGVVRPHEGFENPAIGIETGGVENGVIRAEEGGHLFLKLLVDGEGAADEADRGDSIAPAFDALAGSFDDPGVVRQAEIVIGTEIEHLASSPDGNAGTLGGRDDALLFIKAGLADFA